MQRVDLSKYLVNKKIFDGVTVTLTKSYNRCYLNIYIFCVCARACVHFLVVGGCDGSNGDGPMAIIENKLGKRVVYSSVTKSNDCGS